MITQHNKHPEALTAMHPLLRLTWIVEAGLVTQWGEQEIQKLAHHEAGREETKSATLSLTLEHLQASTTSPFELFSVFL